MQASCEALLARNWMSFRHEKHIQYAPKRGHVHVPLDGKGFNDGSVILLEAQTRQDSNTI